MSQPNIVIVGAGAAGISAAARLLENGFSNITILEAENRIGGRINSVVFDGGIVDLGAQWCHGEEDNIVYNTVKDLNLLSPSKHNYDEFTLCESNGRIIDDELSNKLIGIAFKIGFDTEALGVAKASFGDYFINRYKKEVEAEITDQHEYEVAIEVIELFHKLVTCLDSSPSWFDISAKRSLLYKHCEGNNYWNWSDRGYITILNILMKIYPDPSKALPFDEKIVFQKEVNRIVWRDRLAVVSCTDGSIYEANHVIVTVSLGVLKQKYKTLFEPELPKEKQNAIEHLGYGCVKKVFLRFPHKWWDDDNFDINLLWTEEDRKEILIEFPHGPSQNGHSWLEDVMGFYILDYHPQTLMVWIVGSLIKELELTQNDIIIDGCMFLLKKFVGDKYNIPQPTDMLRSAWTTNPHFNGAYSYQSMNAEKHNVLNSDLAEPLKVSNTNVVLFAGEATHSHYFSTVHGAIETGFREATRVIDTYSNLHMGTKSKL